MAKAYSETAVAMQPVTECPSYLARRLTLVLPGRFPNRTSAQPFASNPRELANQVCGGRLGNAGPMAVGALTSCAK